MPKLLRPFPEFDPSVALNGNFVYCAGCRAQGALSSECAKCGLCRMCAGALVVRKNGELVGCPVCNPTGEDE